MERKIYIFDVFPLGFFQRYTFAKQKIQYFEKIKPVWFMRNSDSMFPSYRTRIDLYNTDIPAKFCLGEDVLKTCWRHLEDVLKTSSV